MTPRATEPRSIPKARKTKSGAKGEQRPTPAEGKDPKTGQFLPGHSGNGGRPRGARSRLAESFLEVLRESFEEAHANGKSCGAHAVRRVRDEDPATYTKIVANLLPKQITGEDDQPVAVKISWAE
jgi:hypothetical protein